MAEPPIERCHKNPVLTASRWSYPVNSVFNPGAIKLKNGNTLLLCRCEDFSGKSHFCTAISEDGYNHWQIDHQPSILPQGEQEKFGIEDARITYLQEEDIYAIVYTSCGDYGSGVSIMTTADFKSYERLGQVFFPENKDAFLFPEKINDLWAMIHRPMIANGNTSIWISYSSDMKAWTGHQCIVSGRGGTYWDGCRIGGSTPVIKTHSGWLMVYHSNKGTAAGCMYRCGLILLDLSDPSKVVRRSDKWFFGPEEIYERMGDVDNVVFPCGWVKESDGDTIRFYYGAADSCIGAINTKISKLMDWLLSNSV